VTIGGGGPPPPPPPDLTPPVLAAVGASSITQTSAVVGWTTNEPASTTVEYGLTTAYGSSVAGAAAVTSHGVSLSGLTAQTLYHFRVSSQDAAGNLVTSGDYTFTTQAGLPPAPVAGFTASPTNGNGPLAVQFTNTSTGGVTAWAWDFGDGETSTLQSPGHTYLQAGDYTVSLTASGPGGSDTARNAWFTSPNLAAIVQEVVDRPGWSAGRGLGLTFGPERATRGSARSSSATRARVAARSW
jgi:chitodextrinase